MENKKMKIEQLKNEVSDISTSLNNLKADVKLTEDEKKKQAEALKTKVDETKKKIDDRIKELSDKTDADSKKEVEEGKQLLETLENIASLQREIIEGKKTPAKTGTGTSGGEVTSGDGGGTSGGKTGTGEKGIVGKSWDWVKEQWNETTWENLKKKPGETLLRGAGFAATGIGALALAYKGVKKLFGRGKKGEGEEEEEEVEETPKKKKKKEKKEKKPFWDRRYGKVLKWTGIGTAAYYISHGIYTKNRSIKDLFDWEKGKKLSFETAMDYCKGALANQNNKEGMAYGMNLKYHEDTGEIEAYGERVKIDKDNRKIQNLEVSFNKYESLINTAILIAYLKKTCSSKCVNNAPFGYTGSRKGNIDVNTGNGGETAADGTGNGGRIVGVTTAGLAGIATGIFGGPQAGIAVGAMTGVVGYGAGYAYDTNNILHDHMPEIDNEYGMKNLAGYLNAMNCWQARNQSKEELTESPIKDRVREVVNKIQKENADLPAEGGRMKFDAIQDPKDKNKYTIKAYGREIKAEVTGNRGNENMRILGITGGTPEIKCDTSVGNISNLKIPLKEGLYMTAIIGKLIEKFHHKGVKYPYFEYTWKTSKMIMNRLKSIAGYDTTDYRGIYFNDKERTINVTSGQFWSVDALACSRGKIKRNMPTIFEDDEKLNNRFVKFLNDGITDNQNVSIRKKS